jgi:hypothetical protein
MKTVFAKLLVVLAGAALVLPFVALSLLVGARAASGVEDGGERLLLAVLAIGGALLGGTKGLRRNEAGATEGKAARASRWVMGGSDLLTGLRGR